MINVHKDDHFLRFLVSYCIELDNFIIAFFKSKLQYYFRNVSQVQLGGGVDFFFVCVWGGGGCHLSADVQTQWDFKIFLALLCIKKSFLLFLNPKICCVY